jgi:ribokinase
MYDIITVGSATIDVFAHTEISDVIKIRSKKEETEFLAYPLGSKILIKELRFTTGGGGTNTAVAFARLGHKTAWLGKLGNDQNAEIIIKELKKENVDVLAIKGNGYTGYSIILDSIAEDRTILAYKGVNDELRFAEVPLKKLKTKWFYFSTMMNESFRTLERLSIYAKKNNIKISFNASTYLAKKGIQYLKRILINTEIFILNNDEAGILTGEKNLEKQFLKLASLGPRIVVITLGKDGAIAYNGLYQYYVKARKVKISETTGAGDAFASGVLSGMIKKNNIEFALKLAKANAESVISLPGAKNNLLNYSEVIKIINRYPCHISKRIIK